MPTDSSKTSACLILIVDDAEEMRWLRREFLQREGYRVIEAADGQKGLEAAIRERPQLILMNNLMPVMNGLEATRQIRRQRGLKKVPIIMNSACSAESTRDLAIKAGCNDYVEEPCFVDELKERIEQLCTKSNEPRG